MAVPETVLLAFITSKGLRAGILAGACSLICSYMVSAAVILGRLRRRQLP